MKKRIFQSIAKSVLLASTAAACALPLDIRADLFFFHDIFSDTGQFLGCVVSEYSSSGVPTNPSLISGLGGVRDLAISGNRLYVLSGVNGKFTIGVYTKSGQTINAS